MFKDVFDTKDFFFDTKDQTPSDPFNSETKKQEVELGWLNIVPSDGHRSPFPFDATRWEKCNVAHSCPVLFRHSPRLKAAPFTLDIHPICINHITLHIFFHTPAVVPIFLLSKARSRGLLHSSVLHPQFPLGGKGWNSLVRNYMLH